MAKLSTETEMKYILDRSSASTVFAPYARILLSQGNIHEARTMAERGVLANPRYVMGHLVLAEAFKAEHDYRQALTQLMIALRLEPTHFEALQLAYQIFKLSNEKAAAAGVLHLIYRVNPSSKLAAKNTHADYGMTIKDILSKVEEVHATQMHHDVASIPMVMNTMLQEETELQNVDLEIPAKPSPIQDATIMDIKENHVNDLPTEFSIHDTVTEESELYVGPSAESSPVNLTQAVPTNFSISLDPEDDGNYEVSYYHDEESENAVSLSDIANHLEEAEEEIAPVVPPITASRDMDATISINDDIFTLPESELDVEEIAHPAIAVEQPHDMDTTISLNDDLFAQTANDELSEAFGEADELLDEAFSASLDELVGELHLHEEEHEEEHESYNHGLDDLFEHLEETPSSSPIEALAPIAEQLKEIPVVSTTPTFSEEAFSFDDTEDPFADLRNELAESLTALGGSPSSAAPVHHEEPAKDLIFNTVPPIEPVEQPVPAPTSQWMDTPPSFETPTNSLEHFETLDNEDPFADLRNELAESLTALGGTSEVATPTVAVPPSPAPIPQPEEPAMDLYFNAVAPPKAQNTMFPSRDLLLASDIVGDDDHHDEKTIAFAMPIMSPKVPIQYTEEFSTTSLLDDVDAAFNALSSDDPEATITLRTSETYQKAPDIFSAPAPMVPAEEAFAPDAWESAPATTEQDNSPFQDMPELNETPAVQPQTLESAFSKLKTELSSYFETDIPEAPQPTSSQGALTPPEPFKPSFLGDDHLAEETYEMTTPLGSLSFSTPAEVEEILSENNLDSDDGISTESFAKPPTISPKTAEPIREIETEEHEESSAPTFSAESLPEHVITTTYADLYLQQDQPEMARSIYQRILEKNPDHDVAQQRLESLEKMQTTISDTPASPRAIQPAHEHKPLAGKKIKGAIRKKLKGKELDE